MVKKWIVVILLAGIFASLRSQGIEGVIRDQNGAPVPYAAIFIKELTRGTTCNALGQFSLPLPAGSYTIFFRSLGYTEVSRNVDIAVDFIHLEIELPPQTYMIPEVRVSASGEDPAYWIMRKAIGLANYHLNEVASYSAEIYIKGTAYIENLPRAIARRIEVNDFRVEEHEAYMLESLNEVQFTAPDKYDMRVIASQNTLPGYSETVNPMDYINASLYQSQIESVISPLARNAFSYYRFSFEGTFMEGTHVINKIRVTPRRKSQQLCEGTLYIVEDLWCLHSSDLKVETIAGTLYLEQLYANVIMDAWLPVNHKIRADVDIAGVRGEITYVSSLEYSNVTLNPNLPEVYFTAQSGSTEEEEQDLQEEPVSKEQEKIQELLEKDELSNRDVSRLSKLMEKEADKAHEDQEVEELDQTGTTFSVARNAVNNDSLFWNNRRPIPLTREEQLTIRERDSVMGARIAATRTDSVSSVRRRSRPFRNILMGKTYYKKQGRLRLTYGGLIDLEALDYNTVDGLYYAQDFRVEWKIDSVHTLRGRFNAGYAFHRTAPTLRYYMDLLYAPMRRGKVWIDVNYGSSDFNQESGIPAFTNMAYTLFLRENYMKKFERIELELLNQIELFDGMELITSANLAWKRALTNHSDFSFLYSKSRDFTPNIPGDLLPGDPAIADHRLFSLHLQLSYTPRQYYIIQNHRKELRETASPTFRVAYLQAIPLEGDQWSDFGRLEGEVSQDMDVGLLSELHWSLHGGAFLRNKSLHYSDFKHFKSSPLLLDMAGFRDALMLMDYYEASSSEYWAGSDVRLTSSYLLIKFLPWFSERLWKESIGFSYLYTPATPHYMQLGYSLEEIFFLVDLGVYVAYQEGHYKGFGARVNFRF
jgi:hypothetical protein